MSDLKYVQTEDLVSRWEMIIEDYLKLTVSLKNELIKFNKMRTELLMIREELKTRKIDVDKPVEINE